jgi:hypothetical protein
VPPKSIRFERRPGRLAGSVAGARHEAVRGTHVPLRLPAAGFRAGETASWSRIGPRDTCHQREAADVALEGRGHCELRARYGASRWRCEGLFDFSRPFQIQSELGLDDAALVRMVDYIRSSPTWTALPKGFEPRTVEGSLPISHVRRTPQGVEVTLLRDTDSGYTVTLEQRNQQWVVVKIALRIV